MAAFSRVSLSFFTVNTAFAFSSKGLPTQTGSRCYSLLKGAVPRGNGGEQRRAVTVTNASRLRHSLLKTEPLPKNPSFGVNPAKSPVPSFGINCKLWLSPSRVRCFASMDHAASDDDTRNMTEKELSKTNSNDAKDPRYVYVLTWDTNSYYSRKNLGIDERALGVYSTKAAAVAAAGTLKVPFLGGSFDEKMADGLVVGDYRNEALLDKEDRVLLLGYYNGDDDVEVHLTKFEIEGNVDLD